VVADNGSGPAGAAVLSTLSGVALTANSIIVQAAVLGDANLDGKVTPADLTIWANNFNNQTATWLQGDFNKDGKVTPADLTIWANHFNQTLTLNPVVIHSLVGTTAAVPEPTSLAVLGIGAAALLTRRRKNKI
jgi:hypothetical protein